MQTVNYAILVTALKRGNVVSLTFATIKNSWETSCSLFNPNSEGGSCKIKANGEMC